MLMVVLLDREVSFETAASFSDLLISFQVDLRHTEKLSIGTDDDNLGMRGVGKAHVALMISDTILNDKHTGSWINDILALRKVNVASHVRSQSKDALRLESNELVHRELQQFVKHENGKMIVWKNSAADCDSSLPAFPASFCKFSVTSALLRFVSLSPFDFNR